MLKTYIQLVIFSIITVFFFQSCDNGGKARANGKFDYRRFKDSITIENYDSSNVFDSKDYIPGIDSVAPFLTRIDTSLHREKAWMDKMDMLKAVLKKGDRFTPEEKINISLNISQIDSFLRKTDPHKSIFCREKECRLYAEVVKSVQLLYLYIDGELVDSFKVSTGIKKYETPEFSVRPAGPMLIKYTSRKFPGGNYQGLGNMPYAVFVRGGYAIHGTTPGNFSKLGNRASHGCIRLHPDNAKIFFGLVKSIGLDYTWVRVRNSLPPPVSDSLKVPPVDSAVNKDPH